MPTFYRLSTLLLFSMLFVSCSGDDDSSELPPETNFIVIPDAQFETLLIAAGIDTDGIVNQQLLKVDALKVSSLDLDRLDDAEHINDLSGIEGFTNLTELSANRNNLKKVDLSANTKLENLYLFQNELEVIDITKNTALKEVSFGSNNLEQIDLSKNTKLLEISMAGNYLETVDISFNTVLERLDLNTNNLTSVTGIEQAVQLNWMSLSSNLIKEFRLENNNIETLFINNNVLTSIEVNQATSLKTLFLQVNKLTMVDLSANTELKDLKLSANKFTTVNLENNILLELLYSSSNLLTSLDISRLSNLVWLTVDRNPSLNCIKISAGQEVANLTKSDNQVLSVDCE